MRPCLLAAALLSFLVITAPLSAQTGRLTGLLTDQSGAVVPDAAVTVTNAATGIVRKAASNEQGYYTVPALPKGVYALSVEATGFRSISRSGVSLDEGQAARLDIALEIGSTDQKVEVTGTAPALETETSAQSTVVPTQQILDLPSNGRNPLALANLVPGVRPVGAFGGLTVSAFGDSRVSISGGSPSVNNIMIDGVAAENHTSGGLQVALSTDATEEFRIITRNASAEFGRTGGGIINFISKSGTNDFHGSAFGFLRNKSLNANDFFSNRNRQERTHFVYNQYGATLGGRLIRNRTFFFGNWERVDQRSLARELRTVPTDLQRLGDFSQTRDASGRLLVVYDPLTTMPDPANPARQIRSAFPDNVIPPARLNPVSTAVLSYYARPNAPGDGFTNANNFRGEASRKLVKDVLGIKVDHYFTPIRRLAGRYTWDDTNLANPVFFGNIADPGGSDTQYPRNSSVLTYIDAPRPDFLIEFRAGLNRFGITRVPRSLGFDVTQINMPAAVNQFVQLQTFPRFEIADVGPIGGNQGDPASQRNNTYTGSGTATWISGGHTVKFGAEQRVYQWNSEQGNGVFQLNFNRDFTKGPDPNAAAVNGFGFASFLLGNPATGVIHRYNEPTYTTRSFSLFLQDDWKFSPKLTLNLGLRWELEGAATDRFNAISNFDPNKESVVNGIPLRGSLVFPGTNGLSRGNREVSWTDFGPRIGFAYQLMRTTVVRGGYGLFFLPTTGIYIRLGSTGFATQTPYLASTDGGFTPANSLSNPFSDGLVLPSGSSLGTRTGVGTNVSGNLRSLERGYSQQWNFSVQQELGSWTVEAGYMGNRGVSLPADRTFDYLPNSARRLGTQLQQQVDNPYASLVSVGPLSQPRVTLATLLDTYPQFTDAVALDNWASSIYHAATLRVERRFSRGLSVLLSYTLSKLIDNHVGNGSNNFADSGSNSVQNWEDLAAERAISTSNQPQRLVISGSYRLPFGVSGPSLYRALAGGWQVNTIASFVSGNVISVTANAPAFGGNRPNVVGDPTLDNPTIDRWLNRDAFVNIPAFTFGNAPRNLPRTLTDGLVNFDSSLFKDFAVSERYRLQFRAEAFNLTNTPTFGDPVSNINNVAFGRVNSLRVNTAPRQVQLALKLYF